MYPVLRALPECFRSGSSLRSTLGCPQAAPARPADSAASPLCSSPRLKSRLLAQPPQGPHSWSWLVTVDVKRL